MAQIGLFLLGSPRIEYAGTPVVIDRRKALALLAYLEATRQRHTRDALAALLWPDDDQRTARASLRRTLAALTSALGSAWFDIDREHIGLLFGNDWSSDLRVFRNRLAAARAATQHETADQAALALLAEAVQLYQGDFLAGFTLRDSPAFDEWQFFQSEELRRELAWALAQLTRGYQSDRAWPAAIDAARRWLALDPLHEPAQRTLMQLYAQSGQRGAALRQYQECVRVLQHELGSTPEAATTDLYEQIRSGAVTEHDDVRTAPAAAVHGFNLRTWTAQEAAAEVGGAPTTQEPQTPFFGRAEERALIARYLTDSACRLVTLVGPGGIGKTRLALEIAHDQQQQFPQGAQVVWLAGVPSGGCLMCAIGQALGIALYPTEPASVQLFAAVQQRNMLLVLDNFEHLVERAGLLGELLAHAPHVKLLITSRERLRLSHEWALELAGLEVPPERVGADADRWSAVQLFVQTAQRVRADFTLTGENRGDVVRICRLVEGMPLGIELAAAWVRMLSCAEIAREISLNLDFLASSLRDVPERHRSIRAAFEHSWQLLPATEQVAFRRLAVFQGGFVRAAAADVADASLATLTALADKSLLRRQTDGRYTLQELLRQYALEKLREASDDADRTSERQCAYYIARLEQLANAGRSADQRQQIAIMQPEIENVGLAWSCAVREKNVLQLERAGLGLCILYESIGWFQGSVDALRQALAVLPLDEQRQIRHTFLSMLSASLAAIGHFAEAELLAQEALALHERGDDRALQATTYERMGKIYSFQGKLEQAQASLEAGLALRRSLQEPRSTVKTMSLVAYNLAEMGRHDQARLMIAETLELCRALDGRDLASTLNNVAYASYLVGEYIQARTLLEDSLAIWQAHGIWIGVAAAKSNLGFNATKLGAWDEAEQLFQDVLQTAYTTSIVPMGLDAMVGLATLLAHAGDAERTVELLALVLNHPASWHETRTRANALLASLDNRIPPTIHTAATQRGRTRSYDDVITELRGA